MRSTDNLYRPMRLHLVDAEGKKFAWTCWWDKQRPANWAMRDHTGYVRILEEVWATSVPRLKLIAENHGFTLLQEIN